MIPKLVTWQHPLLLEWLEAQIESQIPRPATTIALFRGRDPLAVVGYFNYDGISIEGAIAVTEPRQWANKTFVRACFRYPFEQLGCRRFVVRVEASNEIALAFDKKLGFVHEGTLRKASSTGNDVHVLAMLDTEYRASRWYDGSDVFPSRGANVENGAQAHSKLISDRFVGGAGFTQCADGINVC